MCTLIVKDQIGVSVQLQLDNETAVACIKNMSLQVATASNSSYLTSCKQKHIFSNINSLSVTATYAKLFSNYFFINIIHAFNYAQYYS